jgi:hypothetical protein
LCVWVDRGSLGLIGVHFKTGSEAATQLTQIRGEVERR